MNEFTEVCMCVRLEKIEREKERERIIMEKKEKKYRNMYRVKA